MFFDECQKKYSIFFSSIVLATCGQTHEQLCEHIGRWFATTVEYTHNMNKDINDKLTFLSAQVGEFGEKMIGSEDFMEVVFLPGICWTNPVASIRFLTERSGKDERWPEKNLKISKWEYCFHLPANSCFFLQDMVIFLAASYQFLQHLVHGIIDLEIYVRYQSRYIFVNSLGFIE